jgi:glycosyltransferase involved in cell wall biosynthesis
MRDILFKFTAMRIAVNTRLLLPNKLEGIGRFSFEVLKRIVQAHPEIEFHFLFDRPFSEEFIFSKNIVPHVLFPPARHPFLWYAYFEWAVPKKLKEIKADYFWSTDGYASLNTNIPQHLTIHDLAFEHFPKAVPFLVNQYYRHYVPRFTKKATRIAAVSEFTKNDLIQQYSIQSNKIDIVYNGVSDYFKPLHPVEIEAIRQKYSNGLPYFICVSSIHPRKNIPALLKAFDQFKQNNPTAPHQLILVGNFMYGSDNEVSATIASMQHRQDLILTGSLGHEQIASLVGAASATAYVSLFEGFGIPIIESMRAGVPILTSDANSMREVAGNAALLVDPNKIESISHGLTRLAKEEELRLNLIEKGLQRQAQFTWDNSALQYWNSVSQLFS